MARREDWDYTKLDYLETEVVSAALNVVQARIYSEQHPEDPHHGDSMDFANDMLEDHLKNYVEEYNKVNNGN